MECYASFISWVLDAGFWGPWRNGCRYRYASGSKLSRGLSKGVNADPLLFARLMQIKRQWRLGWGSRNVRDTPPVAQESIDPCGPLCATTERVSRGQGLNLVSTSLLSRWWSLWPFTLPHVLDRAKGGWMCFRSGPFIVPSFHLLLANVAC